MKKSATVRLGLASTALVGGALLIAVPAIAQSLPDTGNVSVTTSGLSGGVPGSTNPTFATTGAADAQTLTVNLKDNRTILNWGGNGFNIATGNTVDFKDARATAGVNGRTDNIAVLNRDVSGSPSFVYGTLKSDANVAVYVINRNGLLLGNLDGKGATVSTGAFFGSVSDITDDSAFLNGSSSLRFGIVEPSANLGQTIALGSANITTPADNGGTGGRMGDVVLIGSRIQVGTANFRPVINAGGDAALVAARDVTVQNSPGSPLSIIVSSGTPNSTDALTGPIALSGRNVLVALFNTGYQGARNDLALTGSITATGAAITDRGIVLTAGAATTGVQLGSTQSTADNALLGPQGQLIIPGTTVGALTINSASGLTLASSFIDVSTSLNAAGKVQLAGGVRHNSGTLTGGELLIDGGYYSLGGNLKSTVGDIVFASLPNAIIRLDGTVTSARDILATSLGTVSGTGSLIAGRNISINAGAFELSGFSSTIDAGGSVYINDTGLSGFVATGIPSLVSRAGNVTLLSARAIFGNRVTSAGSLFASSASGMTFGAISAPDGITLTAGTGSLGGDLSIFSAAATNASADIVLTSKGRTTVSSSDPAVLALTAGRDVIVNATTNTGTGSKGAHIANVRAGRNVTVSAFDISGGSVTAMAGAIDLNGQGGALTLRDLTAGLGIRGFGTRVVTGAAIARNGMIDLTATNGTLDIAGSSSATGSVTLTASQQATLSGGLVTDGDLAVTGNGVTLQGLYNSATGFGSFAYRAKGSITIDGKGGGVSSNFGTGVIQSNSDGIGNEPLTIGTTAALNLFVADLVGGADHQSDIQLRYGVGQSIGLRGVTGRSLLGAAGAAAPFTTGLTTTSFIGVNGPIDLTNSLSLTGSSVGVGMITVRGGDVNVRATTDSIALSNNVNASGDVILRSNTKGVSLGSNAILSGRNVVLSAATTFSNLSGAGAINASGHWVVYSANPAGNTFGGLDSGNTAIWGSTLATLAPSSVSGDRYVFALRPTLTFSTQNLSKVYGTDLTGSSALPFTVAGYQPGITGAFLGDTAATAWTGAPLIGSAGLAERASVAGSPYATTIAQGSLASGAGYAFAFSAPGLVTVTPKDLTGTATANTKTYDGTTTGSGSVALSGVLAGDKVGTIGTTFTFADKNAGTGKTVTVAGTTLTGSEAGNYTLSIPATVMGDILKAVLTGTVVATTKTYDGTTTGSGSVSLSGVVAGDSVGTAGTTFAFLDKNAGTGKTVTVAGATLTGADAGNYTLTLPTSALADILKAALTGSVIANNKTYDGTTTGSGSVTINGVVAGDSVGTSGTTFTFADKNAGAAKTVTVGGATLTGADAGNYTLTLPTSTIADILKAALTGTVTANGKTYDGTTTGSGSVSLNGVVAGDNVGTGGTTFTFADKNAGTAKTVTVAGTTLTGSEAGNYTLSIPATALADILKAALTGSAIANSKTYDGTTTGSGSVSLNGVVAGDSVGTGGTTFTFLDKNAATGKTVTVSGTTLTGADAGNYTLTLPTSTIADILKAALTGTVTANGKTYDGTTTGSGSVSLNGVVAGDSVGTGGTTFTFADKNAGTAKTVSIGGTTLNGADAGNYTLSIPATALADILKAALTGSAIANSKTYDGTTAGSGSISLNGVIAGDSVGTAGTTFTFLDKNAATGKTVTVSGTTLTGADAGNYTLTAPASALADILKAALTGTVNANSKTYDGTTTGSGSVSLNGVLAGDSVGTSGTTFTFADKNAGTAKTVSIGGTTLNGADAGNYTLSIPATALADILKAALTGTVVANTKTYDGTTAGSGSVSLNGVIAGDSVGTSGTTFTFLDKNAATGKTVTVSGTTLTGADAGNYTLTVPASALADILKAALTASVAANTKTYDGSTNASGSVTLNGVVAGDSVGAVGTTFTFSDKNAGTGKTVNIGGTTLTGADAGNYSLTVPATALANILKAALTGTVVVNNKTYDGTTATSGTVTLSGAVAGDTVGTTGATFAFADKNAGTGKTVGITGTTLSGADAGNYTLTLPATALADILRRVLGVTADDASKVQGASDPTLSYKISAGSLVAGDSLSGLLSRIAGEGAGSYAITIGSLSAGNNYTLTFTPGTFTINSAPVTTPQEPLRALTLPSQIQVPAVPGANQISIDVKSVCGDDKGCVVK